MGKITFSIWHQREKYPHALHHHQGSLPVAMLENGSVFASGDVCGVYLESLKGCFHTKESCGKDHYIFIKIHHNNNLIMASYTPSTLGLTVV